MKKLGIFKHRKKKPIHMTTKKRNSFSGNVEINLDDIAKNKQPPRNKKVKPNKGKKNGKLKIAFLVFVLLFFFPAFWGNKGKHDPDDNEVALVSSESSFGDFSYEDLSYEVVSSSEFTSSLTMDTLITSSSSSSLENEPISETQESSSVEKKKSVSTTNQNVENNQSSQKENTNYTTGSQNNYPAPEKSSIEFMEESHSQKNPLASPKAPQENNANTAWGEPSPSSNGEVYVDEQGNGQIKGNVNEIKGTKIYHMPWQRDWKKIKMNPSEGDRYFKTEAEARAAGFRRAKR